MRDTEPVGTDLETVLRAFEETGEVEVLDAAIDRCRETARTAEEAERPDLLRDLGLLLSCRFDHSDNAADAFDAVDSMRSVLWVVPEDDPGRPHDVAQLVLYLLSQFSVTGDLADLNEAVAWTKDTLSRLADHPDGNDVGRHNCLLARTLVLRRRFRVTGAPEDLDEAIETCRSALSVCDDDHCACDHTADLGSALLIRYARDGKAEDLAESVRAYRRAVELTLPPHEGTSGDQDQVEWLDLSQLIELVDAGAVLDEMTMLARTVWQRYCWFGGADCLDDAIALARRVVTASRGDHPGHAERVDVLCGALFTRAERSSTPRPTILDEVVDVARRALDTTPAPHPDRVRYLALVRAASVRRFEHNRNGAELDTAIEAQCQLFEALPADDPARGRGPLTGMSTLVADRLNVLHEATDLDRTVLVLRRAVALTPGDDPSYTRVAGGLSRALGERFQRGGDPADHHEAVAMGMRALSAEGSRTYQRVQLARQLGKWLGEVGSWEAACDVFTTGVSLLHRMTAGAATAESVENTLGTVSGLAGDAVAAAINAGRPDEAVLLAERARGVLLTEVLRSRGARTARTVEELPAPAEGTSVVVVNVSDIRSDALLLGGESVRVVPLPGVDSTTVHDAAQTLLAAHWGVGHAVRARDVFERLLGERVLAERLAWLWDVVTRPILDELGHTAPPPPGHPWPRVCWVPCGLLALLPLHAAGDGEDNALDRVVSSFLPVIRLLRPPGEEPTERSTPRMLTVTLPDTPRLPPLPHAEEERELVGARFPHVVALDGSEATVDGVRARLPEFPWVHFVCHADHDLTMGHKRGLLLYDHENGPLTVADIAELDVSGELVFVSACSTGQPGRALVVPEYSIPDESLHIAAAFLTAGYRNVVATLCPVLDSMAMRVVELFYDTLAARGMRDPAEALHEALRERRRTHPNFPTMWSSHLHFGHSAHRGGR